MKIRILKIWRAHPLSLPIKINRTKVHLLNSSAKWNSNRRATSPLIISSSRWSWSRTARGATTSLENVRVCLSKNSSLGQGTSGKSVSKHFLKSISRRRQVADKKSTHMNWKRSRPSTPWKFHSKNNNCKNIYNRPIWLAKARPSKTKSSINSIYSKSKNGAVLIPKISSAHLLVSPKKKIQAKNKYWWNKIIWRQASKLVIWIIIICE